LAGSAWAEYRRQGTLAGEPLPGGLVEAARLDPPVFSPATKAVSGHDENVTFDRMAEDLGSDLATTLRDTSLAVYTAGGRLAADRGLIIADTKFEFGLDATGRPVVIDELLTPDSSRFWRRNGYTPGTVPASFDKQPVRDWLQRQRDAGAWNGEAPAPTLPPAVIAATTARYLEAFERLTGRPLPGVI
jgi:phosphoribosylaminoimidazole-succinocarboxamide synthase